MGGGRCEWRFGLAGGGVRASVGSAARASESERGIAEDAPDAWAGGSAGGGDAECGAGAGGGAGGGGDADGAGAGDAGGQVDVVSVDAGGGAVVGGGGAPEDTGAGPAGGGAAVSGGAGTVVT